MHNARCWGPQLGSRRPLDLFRHLILAIFRHFLSFLMVRSITWSSCISVNAFWWHKMEMHCLIWVVISPGGFNAHIWVSVPGIIGRNGLRLQIYKRYNTTRNKSNTWKTSDQQLGSPPDWLNLYMNQILLVKIGLIKDSFSEWALFSKGVLFSF